MSTTLFTCDDTETLVAYIYGETEAGTNDAVARHAAGCARCRDEIAALGGVRHALAQWTPPAPPLRFSLAQTELPPGAVEPSGTVLRPRVAAWQSVPAWAQVVAATLALAVGAAVANVQVRHDAQGWTVSTGWLTPVTPVAAQPAADQAWRPALAALEQTLRGELESRPLRPRRPRRRPTTPTSTPSPACAPSSPPASAGSSRNWPCGSRSSTTISTCSVAPTWSASNRVSASSKAAPAPRWRASARCWISSSARG